MAAGGSYDTARTAKQGLQEMVASQPPSHPGKATGTTRGPQALLTSRVPPHTPSTRRGLSCVVGSPQDLTQEGQQRTQKAGGSQPRTAGVKLGSSWGPACRGAQSFPLQDTGPDPQPRTQWGSDLGATSHPGALGESSSTWTRCCWADASSVGDLLSPGCGHSLAPQCLC